MNNYDHFPMKCMDFYLLFLFSFISFNISIAQFSIENCEHIHIEYISDCKVDLRPRNRMISVDGSVSTFDLDVKVDLYGDGVIDYRFLSDTVGINESFMYIPAVMTDEMVELILPEDIEFSCSEHHVYWSFTDNTGLLYSCQQTYKNDDDFKLIGSDTLEHYGVNAVLEVEDLYLYFLEFPEYMEDCGFETSFYFEDGISTSLENGLFDYDCEENDPYVRYFTLYYETAGTCNMEVDSLTLRVFDKVFSYSEQIIIGNFATIDGYPVKGLVMEDQDCEMQFINPWFALCEEQWISKIIDEYVNPLDTFLFHKRDDTRNGLTAKDLLLLRDISNAGIVVNERDIFQADFVEDLIINSSDLDALRDLILRRNDYDFPVSWLFSLDSVSREGFYVSDSINQFVIDQSLFFDYTDSSAITLDFSCSKKGDLDGSYFDLDNEPDCQKAEYPILNFHMPDRRVFNNQETEIAFILGRDVDLKAFHLDIDPRGFDSIEILSDVLEIDAEMIQQEEYVMTFLWLYDADMSTEFELGDTIFSLKVTPRNSFDLHNIFDGGLVDIQEIYLGEDYTTHSLAFTDVGLDEYYIENCEPLSIEATDSCSAEVELVNRLLPIIPLDTLSLDSFEVFIEIDLWGDGFVDYLYTTDTTGLVSKGQISHIQRVRAEEYLTISLPESVYFSCQEHKVLWQFTDAEGTSYSCYQTFKIYIDSEIITSDTVSIFKDLLDGDDVFNLDEIDYAQLGYNELLDSCDVDILFSLREQYGYTSGEVRDGQSEYNCESSSFWYYHTLYYWVACPDTFDSLTLEIQTDLNGGPHYGSGNAVTLNNNKVGNITAKDLACNWIINSWTDCSLNISSQWRVQDTFYLEKIDSLTIGLTARDLLLMRRNILDGETLSQEAAWTSDLNDNGQVTTLDFVELQRLILRKTNYDYHDAWMIAMDTIDGVGFYGTELFNQFILADNFNIGFSGDGFQLSCYKKGDLDGSYYDYDLADEACSEVVYDSIAVQLDDVGISAGQEFSIPIILNLDADIKGIHYGLSSDLVENISVTSGVLAITDDMYNAVDSNFVAIWMQNDISSYDYTRGEVLFTLTMTAKEDFQLYELFRNTPEFPREVYLNDDFETHVMDFGDYGLSSSEDLATDLGLDIYPNPFNDELFIQLGGEALHNVKIEMFEIDGRLIKEMKLKRSQANQLISIKKLKATSGIKIIKVRSDEGIYTEKLISL